MQVSIFGLSGDPCTSAHLEIIDRLSKKYDRVIVIPTNVNYYKNYKGHDRAMFSFTERYDNLVEKCKLWKNVFVSDVERDITEGWRFINTLKEVLGFNANSQDYDDILKTMEEHELEVFVAIGSDSLQNFKTWAEWENILRISKLVVFTRPGYMDELPTDINYELLKMDNDISSTKVRENIMSLMNVFEDVIEDDFDTWIDDITWGKDYFDGTSNQT